MKTETKQTHTPGPWQIRKESLREYQDDNAKPQITIIHSDGELLSRVAKLNYMTVCEEHGDYEANARLIAAAPELLEALKNLTEWGRTYTSPRDPNSPHDLLVAAVAAIAKAEGTE